MIVTITSLSQSLKLIITSALHNDSTSPEAKQHAREQLKALGDSNFDYKANVPEEHEKDPAHVAAGLKAYVPSCHQFLLESQANGPKCSPQ